MNETVQIQGWIERLHAGEHAARDELLNCACERLTRITRKVLREFPEVRRWEQTDDVFQNAVLRLCRALETVELTDARHFFRLAALQIRRELIDLARHYRGPQGLGANHLSQAAFEDFGHDAPAVLEPIEATQDPGLVEWTEFHQHAGRLPDDEREVFDLLWYHGLTQEQAASLLKVDVRTIKRRWRSARLWLHERMGSDGPRI